MRIENPSYWASLGVWVVRESVRKSLKRKMIFASKKDLIEVVRKIGKIKFGFDCSQILKKSRIMNEILAQEKITKWF